MKPRSRTRTMMDEVPLLEDALRTPIFATREEEFAACARAARGDRRAIDEICRRNTRLVAMVALKFMTGHSPSVFPDLMQEGLLGICRALQDFDLARGLRFSTYATWWVKAYVLRASRKLRSVVTRDAASEDMSLNVSVTEDSDDTFLDVLRAPDRDPTDDVMGAEVRANIAKMRRRLSRLSKTAPSLGMEVIAERLMAGEGGTFLIDIGERHGLSRERVRQVEEQVKELLAVALADFRDAA